jgi:hypothetical protein
MKAVEIAEGAKQGLLCDVLGIRIVTRQPASEVVRGIQIRQDTNLEVDASIGAGAKWSALKVSWHKRYYRCSSDFIPFAENRE